jgi:hypothetical protein
MKMKELLEQASHPMENKETRSAYHTPCLNVNQVFSVHFLERTLFVFIRIKNSRLERKQPSVFFIQFLLFQQFNF